jgi:hypothetical protein
VAAEVTVFIPRRAYTSHHVLGDKMSLNGSSLMKGPVCSGWSCLEKVGTGRLPGARVVPIVLTCFQRRSSLLPGGFYEENPISPFPGRASRGSHPHPEQFIRVS